MLLEFRFMNDHRPGPPRVAVTEVVHVVADGGRSRISKVDDAIAVEEPLEIRLGFERGGRSQRKSLSVTMRTPGHDEELALGFLYTEGIIRDRDDVVGVGRCGGVGAGVADNVVRVDLSKSVPLAFERLERNFVTTSSCGVCGKSTLGALRTPGLRPPDQERPRVSASTLIGLPGRLRVSQEVFDRTGGLHAAALFTPDGRLEFAREDVGRHNAVDKVVGRLYLDAALPASDRILLVSGRTSFEILQKALAAGIGLVAAVGAPSSLALELAAEFGITLVGFLREGRFNVYTGAQRLSELADG